MGWICNNCETENDDKLDICEVCNFKAPSICDFAYDRILTGAPIKVKWKTFECERVSIVYKDATIDVSDKETFEISDPKDSTITFLLSNSGVSERSFSFDMKFLKMPQIDFSASSLKLNKEKENSTILSWNIKNAESVRLLYDGKVVNIPQKGNRKIKPIQTTTYTIEVLAKDKNTKFLESLQIGVYSESKIDFTADKYYSYPTIPVKLSWNVKYAKKVCLDSVQVQPKGTKVIEPEKDMDCILSVEDEFGIKEKKVTIQMLPLPQAKTLLVPAPNITNNLSIRMIEPKYEVNVRFPTVKIDWVKMKTPQIPSLTNLGLNVELSLPKTTRLNAIKRIYKQIKNKIRR